MSEPTALRDAPAGGMSGIPTLLVRLLVGGAYIYLGSKKVGDPHAFLKGIEQYGVLPLEPPMLINGVAVILPFLEIVIGLVLILGLMRRGAATISFGMLTLFTVLVAQLAMKVSSETGTPFGELMLDCGCGSGAEHVVTKLSVNVALIVGSLWLMVSKSHRFTAAGACGT